MRKLKKGCYALLIATFLMTGMSTAYAANVNFNVTVGGSGTQDPLSKKAMKSNDGDNFAYFRATKTSSPNNGIFVKSYSKATSSIYSKNSAYLSAANAGTTFKREYNKKAPGNQYYYMKARTNGPRITVEGSYCP